MSTPAGNALDGLLATVDGLVRDLADAGRTESVGSASRGAPGGTVRRRAVVILVVLAAIVVELLVLAWLLSSL